VRNKTFAITTGFLKKACGHRAFERGDNYLRQGRVLRLQTQRVSEEHLVISATNRAHRIGQDKPVFVYKLLTEGRVEEKILALQEKKRKLADSVYGKGKKGSELLFDAETIETLLAGE
jgi:hypothetical protein